MYLPCLFYADDGILLARSVIEVRNMELIVGKFGLKINRSKSKCLIFNASQLGQDIPDDIGEMEVVEGIKYLGIVVQNKRNCFGGEETGFGTENGKCDLLCGGEIM